MKKPLFRLPQFRNFSLRTKLIISFVAVTLISVSIVGFISNRITSAQITAQTGKNLLSVADGNAREISSSLDNSIVVLQTLTINKFMQDTVQAASATAKNDLAAFSLLDQQWAQAKDSDTLIQGVTNNDLASELKEFQEAYPDYVEIFTTDKYGAILASTNRTSDYYQGDEGWWQTAWNNGKGAIYVGQPEFDESTKTFSVNMARPIISEDVGEEPVGVLRFTLNITGLTAMTDAVKVGATGHSSLIFGGQIYSGGKTGLTDVDPAELARLTTLLGNYGETTYEGVPSLVSVVPITAHLSQHKDVIDQLGWKVIVHQATSEALQPVTTTSRSILLTGLIIALLVALAALVLAQFLAGPLVRLTAVAQQVAAGNINLQAKVESSDESGKLAGAFNNMTSRLREFISSLESRVVERTQSLELAAEVGRSVSQVRALDIMLKDAAELIQAQFDLYYVQVYLADASQTNLILKSGTGNIGAELIARNHRLPLNTTSINGRAAIEKRSVVISNTGASATFRPNPLLPDTRSEMAVPLLVGGNVVGVLDLQSQKIDALNTDILPAFEALAGQLAIAVQNSNLLAEANQARADVEAQARLLVRTGWEDYLDAIHKPEHGGYVFEENKITSISEPQPAAEGAGLTVPITISGETIGTLVVEMDQKDLTAQDKELLQSVARQVGQQIENQRLLESAERYRFEAEQASRRLTREGWQEYMETKSSQGLGYLYDLNEVRPASYSGPQTAEEPGVSVPIKVREESVGKLGILGQDALDDDSLAFASAVAERLGAHIESLRQNDQTQAALAQSEKLFEASRRLTLATTLQDLVKSAVETLNIPVVNRAILGTLTYNAADELESMSVAANWWSGTGFEVDAAGKYFSAEALRMGSMSLFLSSIPLFINDALLDNRADPAAAQAAKDLNFRSLAVLPLFLGTRQTGVLILEGEIPHAFTQDETRLFTALAPQIATVLENRRQFERAQHQADRESMLNVINQKIQAATSVEAVLQIAARELGHALGAPRTIAQLSFKDQK